MLALWRLCQIKNYRNLSHGLTKIKIKFQKNSTRGLKIDHYGPKEITEKAENKLRMKDKLTKDYTLIYKSTMSNYIHIGFHTSYIILGGSLYGLIRAIINVDDYEFLRPEVLGELTTPYVTLYDQMEMVLSYSGLVVINSLMYLFCRRHAIRIWYHTKDRDCVMIVPTFLPNSVKKVVFKPGAIAPRFPRARIDVTRAPHVVNNRIYYITENNFRRPADYSKIMYDVL